MKNLKILTVLVAVILLISFSCKSEAKKEAQHQQPKTEEKEIEKKCKDKPKPSLEELNEKVRFNVNLDNQCDFQPVHMETCTIKDYAIIGRFKSDKKNKNSRNLKSIELYAYNLSEDEDQREKNYKVTKIERDTLVKKNNLVKIKVTLSSASNAVEKAKKDFINEIKFSKNTILDFSVNDDLGYCLFHGTICKANVIFE